MNHQVIPYLCVGGRLLQSAASTWASGSKTSRGNLRGCFMPNEGQGGANPHCQEVILFSAWRGRPRFMAMMNSSFVLPLNLLVMLGHVKLHPQFCKWFCHDHVWKALHLLTALRVFFTRPLLPLPPCSMPSVPPPSLCSFFPGLHSMNAVSFLLPWGLCTCFSCCSWCLFCCYSSS